MCIFSFFSPLFPFLTNLLLSLQIFRANFFFPFSFFLFSFRLSIVWREKLGWSATEEKLHTYVHRQLLRQLVGSGNRSVNIFENLFLFFFFNFFSFSSLLFDNLPFWQSRLDTGNYLLRCNFYLPINTRAL